VNCRIQWIIESLNTPCAPWVTYGACLFECHVNLNSLRYFLYKRKGLSRGIGFGGFMQVPLIGKSAPLKDISWRMKQKWLLALFHWLWCNNCFIMASWGFSANGENIAPGGFCSISLLLICQIYLTIHVFSLASNQVGLPAELKHIIKRRKRN